MERAELHRRLRVALVSAGRSNAERTRGGHGAAPMPLADVGRVRHCACQWPMWPAERGSGSPLFCSAATTDGGPYCREHAALAAAPAPADPATRELHEAAKAFQARWSAWIAQRQPDPAQITEQIAGTSLQMARLAGLAQGAAEAGR
jgi:hypothetical protein